MSLKHTVATANYTLITHTVTRNINNMRHKTRVNNITYRIKLEQTFSTLVYSSSALKETHTITYAINLRAAMFDAPISVL